jgi:hydrogenase maturation protease
MKPLVVGLGNDLLGDDAVGILAAQKLARELSAKVDVIETSLHGLALLDLFVGYNRLIIIDAISTGELSPGDVIELDPRNLRAIPGPSPHYTGLPELITIASQLQLEFPEEIKIIAVEVASPHTFGRKLSDPVATALGEVVRRVKEHLRRWEEEEEVPAAWSSHKITD